LRIAFGLKKWVRNFQLLGENVCSINLLTAELLACKIIKCKRLAEHLLLFPVSQVQN
jgi:hypothetical protein